MIRRALVSIALVASVGCAVEPVPDAGGPDCRKAQRLTSNGIVLNALSMNALSMNALSVNALSVNSLMVNGEVEAVQGVVVDADLEARLAEGSAAAGESLLVVGVNGTELPVTIVEVSSDQKLRYLKLALADGTNPCGALDAQALIVPGVWDLASGDRHDAMQVGAHELRHSLSCTNGVIAKCVVWGYDPAEHGAAVHQSCTRLARADYCGDGVPHTENGTTIDVYDTLGILEPEGGLDFEAGWGPDGAVCVNHPRYLDVVVGEGAVYPSCWNELPRCADRSEAEQHGALLVNDSTTRERTWCSAADVPR